MITIYVLMVLTSPQYPEHASGAVTFQEFTTKQRCEYAKALITGDRTVKLATCVEK